MKATKSFNKDCEIGEGGFGKVYLAQLDDNKQVAIKRASGASFQGIKEFRNEIILLSRLHHRHLVRLEGFCDEKTEQVYNIVYDASRILVVYIIELELTLQIYLFVFNINFIVDPRLRIYETRKSASTPL
mgnify:FL=1